MVRWLVRFYPCLEITKNEWFFKPKVRKDKDKDLDKELCLDKGLDLDLE